MINASAWNWRRKRCPFVRQKEPYIFTDRRASVKKAEHQEIVRSPSVQDWFFNWNKNVGCKTIESTRTWAREMIEKRWVIA